MSRIQMSASVAGECDETFALKKQGDFSAANASRLAPKLLGTDGRITIVRWSMLDFAMGCAGDVVCFPDVLQQVLFAQHPGLHAFEFATLERMHDCAETGIATTGSVIASKREIANLLNMAPTS